MTIDIIMLLLAVIAALMVWGVSGAKRNVRGKATEFDLRKHVH